MNFDFLLQMYLNPKLTRHSIANLDLSEQINFLAQKDFSIRQKGIILSVICLIYQKKMIMLSSILKQLFDHFFKIKLSKQNQHPNLKQKKSKLQNSKNRRENLMIHQIQQFRKMDQMPSQNLLQDVLQHQKDQQSKKTMSNPQSSSGPQPPLLQQSNSFQQQLIRAQMQMALLYQNEQKYGMPFIQKTVIKDYAEDLSIIKTKIDKYEYQSMMETFIGKDKQQQASQNKKTKRKFNHKNANWRIDEQTKVHFYNLEIETTRAQSISQFVLPEITNTSYLKLFHQEYQLIKPSSQNIIQLFTKNNIQKLKGNLEMFQYASINQENLVQKNNQFQFVIQDIDNFQTNIFVSSQKQSSNKKTILNKTETQQKIKIKLEKNKSIKQISKQTGIKLPKLFEYLLKLQTDGKITLRQLQPFGQIIIQ